MGKFKASQVEKLSKQRGRHADGDGLYLVVRQGKPRDGKQGALSARWYLFYYERKKRREMALGKYPTLSLADARNAAREAQTEIAAGVDIIAERKKEVEPNFGAACDIFLSGRSFNTERTEKRWHYCLKTHAKPLHGQKPSEITIFDIHRVLSPLWIEKHETAKILRYCLQEFFGWIIGKGWRDPQHGNPAVWEGGLKSMLQSPKTFYTVKPQRAIDWKDVPEFMSALVERDGIAPLLVRFVLLTGVRSGEARGARWNEIDRENCIWNIPAERMKMRKPHEVPLSDKAMMVLDLVEPISINGLIFPNPDNGKPLSYNAPRQLFKRMGWHDRTTLHGLRSAFRSWIQDATSFDYEAAERCLAHVSRDAYRRGNLLEKRKVIMQTWADFCYGLEDADNVVPLSFTSS